MLKQPLPGLDVRGLVPTQNGAQQQQQLQQQQQQQMAVFTRQVVGAPPAQRSATPLAAAVPPALVKPSAYLPALPFARATPLPRMQQQQLMMDQRVPAAFSKQQPGGKAPLAPLLPKMSV